MSARILTLLIVAASLAPAEVLAESALDMHVRGKVWTFSHEQLMAMTEPDALPNMRGTRTKPALALDRLIREKAGLEPEQLQRVIVLRVDGLPVIIRGETLQYLDRLVLTSGPDKHGEPHPWSLAPADEATHEALIREVGARRKHLVNRIDIVPLESVEP